MNDLIKLALSLCVVAVVAGFAIGLTYRQTHERIVKTQQQATREALSAVAPGNNTTIKQQTGSKPLPDVYWTFMRNDTITGYAFKVYRRGYSSVVECMVGVDTAGVISGMTVLSQTETPGLGTRIEERLSDKYIWNGLFAPSETSQPWFMQQFTGLHTNNDISIASGKEWHLRSGPERQKLTQQNRVTAITGATITTRAVIQAINEAIPLYMRALETSASSMEHHD